jgi:hypothetical protein
MAETLRGHARLGIAEVQVALTMGGAEGVRAFAPVIAELRSGRPGAPGSLERKRDSLRQR